MAQSGEAVPGDFPEIQQRWVPLAVGAPRATNFEVRFDGGAFTLHIYETRESAEPRPGALAGTWETVEVGRFSISPIAAVRLQGALSQGIAAYRSAMGHAIPDENAVQAALKKLAERSRQ